jgi:hypothetical protein
MMPTIPSKDTVVTLSKLHPPPLDLVLPFIFGFQPKQPFVLDTTLFAQALTTTRNLSSGGLYGHLLKCFIPEDPSLGFLRLFQVVVIVHGDIPRSVALMLGGNKLSAMAKDTNGLCPITIGEIFFLHSNHSIVF